MSGKPSTQKEKKAMESIDIRNQRYAIIFNVNLVRATLNEASEFKEVLDDAIKTSNKDLIVNLTGCQHLDSTFLGLMVSSYKKLKSQNRNLLIIEPADQTSVFLTLNSIGKIFPIYHDVKTALTDLENKRTLENQFNGIDEEIDLEPESLESDQVEEEEIVEIKEEEFQEPINLQEIMQTDESINEDLLIDPFENVELSQEIHEEIVDELEILNDNNNDEELNVCEDCFVVLEEEDRRLWDEL